METSWKRRGSTAPPLRSTTGTAAAAIKEEEKKKNKVKIYLCFDRYLDDDVDDSVGAVDDDDGDDSRREFPSVGVPDDDDGDDNRREFPSVGGPNDDGDDSRREFSSVGVVDDVAGDDFRREFPIGRWYIDDDGVVDDSVVVVVDDSVVVVDDEVSVVEDDDRDDNREYNCRSKYKSRRKYALRVEYDWYCIDPYRNHPDSASPERIFHALPTLNCGHRTDLGYCTLGSKIYAVGGLRLHPWKDGEDDPFRYPLHPVYSDEIYVCDTNSKPISWNKAGSMLGARESCLVVPVDGILYIFGSSCHDKFPNPVPWCEYFDPATGKCTELEDPPIIHEYDPDPNPKETLPTPCMAYNYLSVGKQISVYISQHKEYYFNPETRSWCGSSSGRVVGVVHSGHNVAVGQLVYALLGGHLYFYNIDQQDLPPQKIPGVEQYHIQDPSFLFHLGCQHFCLVWSQNHFDDIWRGLGLLIHCLQFHLAQDEQTQVLKVVVDTHSKYITRGAHLKAACLVSDEASAIPEENEMPTKASVPGKCGERGDMARRGHGCGRGKNNGSQQGYRPIWRP